MTDANNATAAGSHQATSPGAATPTPAGTASGQAMTGTTQASSAAPGEIGKDWQARVDQRIQAMRTALDVTPNEEAAFNHFAHVMRENATAMDNLLHQRMSDVRSMNALENMRSYEQLANQHAEDVRRLTAAFETFYDKLSPEQKQQADQMFRQRASEQIAAHHS